MESLLNLFENAHTSKTLIDRGWGACAPKVFTNGKLAPRSALCFEGNFREVGTIPWWGGEDGRDGRSLPT